MRVQLSCANESWVDRGVLVAWDAGSGVAGVGGQRMVIRL